MKKYLFGILAIALALGFSAFTTKKAHKPFTYNATAYHNSGACEEYIGTGTDIFECRNSGMTSAYGFNATYWNSSSNLATLGTGDFIAKVEYNTADYATIAALLSDLKTYFDAQSPKALPSDGTEFNPAGNGTVKIRRATGIY